MHEFEDPLRLYLSVLKCVYNCTSMYVPVQIWTEKSLIIHTVVYKFQALISYIDCHDP